MWVRFLLRQEQHFVLRMGDEEAGERVASIVTERGVGRALFYVIELFTQRRLLIVR